jgi:class 3 adenylate cyclase
VDVPETHYAKSGGVNIAYQVVGDSSIDIVAIPALITHVELLWEHPPLARFLSRLGSFSRLIILDPRGTGLSDRVPDSALPTLEERMDDVRAVQEAVGSERAALLAFYDVGPMAALFAATYPERTSALILYGSFPRWLQADDYPWGLPYSEYDRLLAATETSWGPRFFRFLAVAGSPSSAHDEDFQSWWAKVMRFGVSPGAAKAIFRMAGATDVREILPSIRVPTLILQRTDVNPLNQHPQAGRYMAERIPSAKLVEFPGVDWHPFRGDQDAILDEVAEFLTGMRLTPTSDRVLATILFTDIVDSTRRAAEVGDDRWRDLLERHHGVVRRQLERFRGREINTAGDGFLATFDGPARAIQCGNALAAAVHALGLEIRAGVHTGEVEIMGEDVGGIAVHIAARVMAQAGAGEVLVSGAVPPLVAGSGLEFEDRGMHGLKGVPGEWRLYAARS